MASHGATNRNVAETDVSGLASQLTRRNMKQLAEVCAGLKARQLAERAGRSQAIDVRIRRALSWLERASRCEDEDGCFIFLWISFNAAYANDLGELEHSMTETRIFNHFLRRLVMLDEDKVLYHLVWSQFNKSIRVLLDNQYVFPPFWEYQRGRIAEEEWRDKFEKAKTIVHRALGNQDTVKILWVVFERLYTLRNQLMHGAATWDGDINRAQLRDGTNIMCKVAPRVIELLLDHPDEVWGDAMYPVVD